MTSKPSTTNCPNTFAVLLLSDVMSFLRRSRYWHVLCASCQTPFDKVSKSSFGSAMPKRACHCSHLATIFRWLLQRGPTSSIPNREVKPACADGTAMQCGRVGGRHFYSEPRFTNVSRGFFVMMTGKHIKRDLRSEG